MMLVPADLLVHLFADKGMTKAKALAWSVPLSHLLAQNDIEEPAEIAMFLAHAGHESGGLSRLVENLNYSAQGLVNTWPSRFPTVAFASMYARQPVKIANFVYGARMGNRGVASGDGAMFRGRGLLQTTGRDNYTKLASALGMTLEALVPFLETREGAIKSAINYWKVHKLSRFAKNGDVRGSTQVINGGLNGLKERMAIFSKAMMRLSNRAR